MPVGPAGSLMKIREVPSVAGVQQRVEPLAVGGHGFQQVGVRRVFNLGAACIVDLPAKVGRYAVDKRAIRLYAETGTDDLL